MRFSDIGGGGRLESWIVRGPIRIAVACAVLAASACFADLGGFSGGADATGDGGPGPSDATADDGTPMDGGTDAPSGEDTGVDGGPFCANAPPHAACADYDDGNAATGFITPRDHFGPATSALDTVVFASPPSSLAIFDQPDASGEAWVFEAVAIPTATKTVHVAADIRACAFAGVPGSSTNVLFSVNHETSTNVYATVDVGVHPTPTGNELYVEIRHDNASVTTDLSAGAALPTDRFARVVLDVTLGTTNGAVSLSVDGTSRVALTNITTDSETAKNRRVAVGSYVYDATAPCNAWIDDVLVSVAP